MEATGIAPVAYELLNALGVNGVLVFTGDQTSLDPLQRLAHDKDSEVASEAYRALRAIRARGATSAAATSAGVRMRAAGG